MVHKSKVLTGIASYIDDEIVSTDHIGYGATVEKAIVHNDIDIRIDSTHFFAYG